MSQSKLRVRPKAPDHEGRIHHITPESAGWTYVGFDVFALNTGASLSKKPIIWKSASCWWLARPKSLSR